MNSVRRSSSSRHEIFGLADGKLTGLVPLPDPPELEAQQGGFGHPATRHWPRTCLSFLPASMPADIDLDGDGKPEGRATLAIRVLDRNGDGVPNEGDLVLLVPLAFRLTRDGVLMVLSESLLREACARVAKEI